MSIRREVVDEKHIGDAGSVEEVEHQVAIYSPRIAKIAIQVE